MTERDPLTGSVIGAAIEVHRNLGPGLLESVYEKCFYHELRLRGVPVRKQIDMPIVYKDLQLEHCLTIDLLIADRVIVELKAVEAICPVHEAQLLTYLKLSGLHTGLLINFNVAVLKDGIKRMVL